MDVSVQLLPEERREGQYRGVEGVKEGKKRKTHFEQRPERRRTTLNRRDRRVVDEDCGEQRSEEEIEG
jgi:hypothetical protein